MIKQKFLTALLALLTISATAWAAQETINWPIGNGGDTGWGGSITLNGIKIQSNGSSACVDNKSN